MTRNTSDVVAKLAVMVAGLIVLVSGYRHTDLLVGTTIGMYVVTETLEILGEAAGPTGKRNLPAAAPR